MGNPHALYAARFAALDAIKRLDLLTTHPDIDDISRATLKQAKLILETMGQRASYVEPVEEMPLH